MPAQHAASAGAPDVDSRVAAAPGGADGSALPHLLVVDASECVPGQFAGRLFADHGARVVLVEPPEGSCVRRRGPVLHERPGSSLLFEHLNGGKESVTVDRADPDGRARLADLCRSADVVLLPGDGSDQDLADLPGVVVVLSDFGSDGPYSTWRGSELVHQALSGSMYVTGLQGRPPLFGVGDRASFAAGLHAYIGALAGVHQRDVHGQTFTRLEVTTHEAAAALEQNFCAQFGYNGTIPRREENHRPRGRARCADGWVVYFVRDGQWPLFCDVFEAPHLAADPRFTTWNALVRNLPAALAELDAAAAGLEVEDVLEASLRHKLVLAPMAELASLRTEEHLVQRGFWQHLDSSSGVGTALGPVLRLGRTPADRSRPAPRRGGPPPAARPTDRAAPSSGNGRAGASGTPGRPLDGVRVLDVGSAWAGPMAARILGLLGADVVKLEGPGRVDSWRGELVDPPTVQNYPDQDAGAAPYNRHAWFNNQNHDKRSLVMDLKDPRALEILHRMVPDIDVVLANWSPGALDRAGLGHARLATLNPRIVVVEMPALGSTGPLAGQRGLGYTMEAMAGIGGLIGYPDSPPLGSGTAYLDPIGALHGAAAVLTALVERDRSGRGQHVEVAQREAAMHWIGELLLDCIENGVVHTRAGNDVDGISPHGAYPAAGEDEWVALAAHSDEEWLVLCDVLGAPDAAADGRLRTAAGRTAHQAEVDALVGGRTRTHDKHRLAVRLQEAGIRAAPVVDAADLYADPHLRARDWFCRLTQRDAGTHDYPGLPYLLDGHRLHPRTASPSFGEHNGEVLRDLLGLGDDAIAELTDAGVLARRPGGARRP